MRSSTTFKKGHRLSKESIDKIRTKLKGRKVWNTGTKGLIIAWNKGKKNVYTLEQKQKMSDTHKKLGLIPPSRKGIKLTKEQRIQRTESTENKKEKHWNWKGGINPINDSIRKSLEYKLWRDACFARDGYTCQKTGVKGDKLVVHHIFNFSKYPELRFAIDNGVTLSVKVHKEFHQIYGIKNNTREQLEEFLSQKEIEEDLKKL